MSTTRPRGSDASVRIEAAPTVVRITSFQPPRPGVAAKHTWLNDSPRPVPHLSKTDPRSHRPQCVHAYMRVCMHVCYTWPVWAVGSYHASLGCWLLSCQSRLLAPIMPV